MSEPTIGVFEVEDRTFPPAAAFVAAAKPLVTWLEKNVGPADPD